MNARKNPTFMQRQSETDRLYVTLQGHPNRCIFRAIKLCRGLSEMQFLSYSCRYMNETLPIKPINQ